MRWEVEQGAKGRMCRLFIQCHLLLSVVVFFFVNGVKKDTNTKTEPSLAPRLRVCLPPALRSHPHHSSPALPLLSCDVFWPDSMAPGRQWHDHRNRGQQGHSSLFGESRK